MPMMENITPTVAARQGVGLNALIEIKQRVMLRPFRTYLEVEQNGRSMPRG